MSEQGLLTAENPGAETGETNDVFASVPKEIRYSADGNDKLARFSDAGALAKSYLEMEKMASGKVKIPTDTSSPDEVSAFYKKLGRPDSVEGYELPQLQEGQQYDDNLLSTIRAAAFESGVSSKQFNTLVGKYIEAQQQAKANQLAEQNAEAEATVKDLQGEWGNDYDQNLEISKRALRELAPDDIKDDLINMITDRNLDNNKMFVKFLKHVGEKILDDSYVKGEKPKEEPNDYTPKYPNSPEMYRNGDDEESAKGRQWHENKGYKY